MIRRIGDTIRAYCQGRDDARHGRRKGRGRWSSYGQGYRDERARMRREKRLAQLPLAL